MKKNLIAAGCIFLLAVIALPVSVYYIDQGKNAIVITQEVIEGSPEAASGIVLHMENTWNHNLFWETEYVIRSGEPAKSHFTFYAASHRDLRTSTQSSSVSGTPLPIFTAQATAHRD